MPAYLKKINWLAENNCKTGLFHILDPIYYRIVGDWLLLVLYLVLAFVTQPYVQLSLVAIVSALNLLRLARLPFMPHWLNLFEFTQWLCMLAYALLGLAAVRLYETALLNSTNQNADKLTTWMQMGWAMLGLLCGFVAVALTKEVLVWATPDQLEEVIFKPEEC